MTDKVKDAFQNCNTTVLVIPGGRTSILQPLDININKPVKGHLRTSWVQYMLEHSSEEVIKRSPKQLVVNWIEDANRMLDSNMNMCIVKKAFMVTGLSNALGGEENELIRDDTFRKK